MRLVFISLQINVIKILFILNILKLTKRLSLSCILVKHDCQNCLTYTHPGEQRVQKRKILERVQTKRFYLLIYFFSVGV